ncbi:MAG: hypothetical protein QM767_19925 [Anaeromyxobacter sp.]
MTCDIVRALIFRAERSRTPGVRMADAPIHEFEKVRFFAEHLETKGQRVEYSRIRSLDFARITQNSSGQAHHQTILLVELTDGSKPVEFSVVPNRSIFGGDDYDARAGALDALHTFLARATYDQRLRYYLTELSERGYFTYGDKRFHPDGTVALENGRTVSVTEHALSVQPHSITIEIPAAKKGLQRFKDFWDSPRVQILAFTNNDCMMALLKLVYGIQWFKMDDLRFGATSLRKPGETTRPPDHVLFSSPAPRNRSGSEAATDFRNVDSERVLDACKAMAAHLADFAAPRVQASKLQWGFGYQMLDVKSPEAVQAFAKCLPESAFLGYSFGVLCMLACVHLPAFPGTEGYQKARTLVGTELWYRMLDGLPKLVHTAMGEKLTEMMVRTAIAEIDAAFKNVQECAGLMNAHADNPLAPLQRALAKRTGLWVADDAVNLDRSLHDETKNLLALGAGVLGVPVSPSAAKSASFGR